MTLNDKEGLELNKSPKKKMIVRMGETYEALTLNKTRTGYINDGKFFEKSELIECNHV
jgi:hypothetical protein